MPKLSSMLGETGTVEIPVSAEEPLIVEYRRGILTPRLQKNMALFQARLQATDGSAAADPDALDFMCDMFSKLIASWNLTDDSGQVIGTDAESLADVDLGILTLVMQQIAQQMTPDPLSDSDSNNGSSQTGSLGPRLITTAS